MMLTQMLRTQIPQKHPAQQNLLIVFILEDRSVPKRVLLPLFGTSSYINCGAPLKERQLQRIEFIPQVNTHDGVPTGNVFGSGCVRHAMDPGE